MARITALSATDDILAEIGDRLQHYRLQQDRTLEELASSAGVGTSTLERAEAGGNTTLRTLVKVLRALGRTEALESFLPPALISPLELAGRKRRPRQRARGSGGPPSRPIPDAPTDG